MIASESDNIPDPDCEPDDSLPAEQPLTLEELALLMQPEEPEKPSLKGYIGWRRRSSGMWVKQDYTLCEQEDQMTESQARMGCLQKVSLADLERGETGDKWCVIPVGKYPPEQSYLSREKRNRG